MSIFDGNMPYTNLHELNLDWIVKNVKESNAEIEKLKSLFTDELENLIREQLQTLFAEVVYDENNQRIIMTVGGI